MATRIEYNNFSKDLSRVYCLNSIRSEDGPYKIKTFEDFINETKILMQSTQDQDLKIGLKIMLTLISHDKKDVVAYSLGKLYSMINDDITRKIILEELKIISEYDDPDIRRSAEESMDTITGELDSYEIFELGFEIFDHLILNLISYSKKFIAFIPENFSFVSMVSSEVESKIKYLFKSLKEDNKFKIRWNDMMYSFTKLLIVLDADLNIMQINEDELNDYYLQNTVEPEIIPYSDIMNLEFTKENYLNTLADIYATTFRENGHINHLLRYLDDDNYKIRRIGVLDLIYVLKILTHFESKSPYENFISYVFANRKHGMTPLDKRITRELNRKF